MKPNRLVSVAGAWLSFLLGWAPSAVAQQAVPGDTGSSSIASAWDNLIKDAIPQAPVDPALKVPQTPVTKGAADDFESHFFLDTNTRYEHSGLDFTGAPTNGGIIPGPATNVFNPAGYNYPAAFQPTANRIYEFLDFGTTGWGSDRINTHFGVRYHQDLTAVDQASQNANILGTYTGGKLVELLNASLEINSRPTDGAWAGSSLVLGRQDVYGAEMAELDGASYRLKKRRVELTLFGGRRFTYYSDPDQRAIGGAGLVYHPDTETTVSYETLLYIRATQKVSLRRRLGAHWSAIGYFRTYGGSPVDFNAQFLYQSRSGRDSARFRFFQKLSGNDYLFDFTEAARNMDPNNPLFRLNFSPLKPYTLFAGEGRHSFSSRFSLSGAVVAQRLDNNQDQSDFQTSFQDYRVDARLVPLRKVGMDFGYHEHDSDRLAPLTAGNLFDAVSTSGETSVKDLSGNIGRTFFAEGRLTLSGGAYYRRINMQDRFYEFGAHQSGWLAGARLKLDDHTRLIFDYALDNDFMILEPALSDARTLRVGMAWKY